MIFPPADISVFFLGVDNIITLAVYLTANTQHKQSTAIYLSCCEIKVAKRYNPFAQTLSFQRRARIFASFSPSDYSGKQTCGTKNTGTKPFPINHHNI